MRFFESARAHYWRSLGRSYQDLVNWGVAMPVVEAHCNYKRPAHYEDLLIVDTRVSELRAASLRFAYVVKRDDEILAEGYTRHAIINNAGKPIALPDALKAMIPVPPKTS
jgi:acyl-CoA thioester hydrolase